MEHILNWLNENELRAYPLLDAYANPTFTIAGENWVFPDNFILDLQLIIKNFSLYADSVYNTVYLKNISYTSADGVTIEFAGSDPNHTVTSFNIQEIEETFPVYVRNEDGSLIVLGEGLLDFVEACNNNSVFLEINIPVEPGTCIEYREAWEGVTKITATPEKESDSENSAVPLLPLEVVSTPSEMQGDLVFSEGYNFNVAILNGLIDLLVSPSYGLAMDCSTHFIASEFLDCSSIVSYINGIPPDSSGNFRILSGGNIAITQGQALSTFSDTYSEQANENTLFVSFSFSKTDLCAPITPTIL